MLKILQISDLHILPNTHDTLLGIKTWETFCQVLAHAHQQHGRFDLIIVSGDLAQHPCVTSYQRIAQQLRHYQTPALCLPGNHDDWLLMQQILSHAPIHCQQQTQLGRWQIISLNSQKPHNPGGHLTAQELELLQQALASNPDHFTLLAVHHHCLPCGSAWLDSIKIDNGEALLTQLAAYPQVRGVICGHVHQAIEQTANGITLLSAPSTCFQFAVNSAHFAVDNQAPGYRLLELHDDGRLVSKIERIANQIEGLDTHSAGY